MLNSIYRFSKARLSWLLLLVSAILIFVTAIIFQHLLKYEPCVYCVYIRLTFVFIIGTALIGLAYPKLLFTRVLAISAWIISSVSGLLLSIELITIKNQPVSLFGPTCDVIPNFPTWAPLHHWLPAVFEPRASCTADDWSIFGLNMADLAAISFSGYLLCACVVLLANIRYGFTD